MLNCCYKVKEVRSRSDHDRVFPVLAEIGCTANDLAQYKLDSCVLCDFFMCNVIFLNLETLSELFFQNILSLSHAIQI